MTRRLVPWPSPASIARRRWSQRSAMATISSRTNARNSRERTGRAWGLRWWPALLLLAGAATGVAGGVRRLRPPRLRLRSAARASRPRACRAGLEQRAGSDVAAPAACGGRLGRRAAARRAGLRDHGRGRRRSRRRLRGLTRPGSPGERRRRRRLLRDADADPRAPRGRLRDLLGAAAARGGGRRPGRDPAHHPAAPLDLAGRARRGDCRWDPC